VNTDKSAYLPGETVHISGAAINPSMTWDYTYTVSDGNGLEVQIQIFDSNNNLIHSGISSPSAASYKNYAYDYTLPNDAPLGTYTIRAMYPFMNLNGEGSFTVYQILTMVSTVTTGTTTYTTTIVTSIPDLPEVTLALLVSSLALLVVYQNHRKEIEGGKRRQ
jgi:uncharacterized protein YfaS (alpha-2-macroglobulin family)